ncbi:hypothetical protein H5410_037047 [Solanum commersonii]|uniref:Uncharacterized protein n=1 Tax=Solanum commersonii TaxID=4109 RepID=A0A9J5Y7D7_SOLCO|nr:hypothetical protein H5410_037047 [Solanum commersonii]
MKCGIKYEGNRVSSNPWRRIKRLLRSTRETIDKGKEGNALRMPQLTRKKKELNGDAIEEGRVAESFGRLD